MHLLVDIWVETVPIYGDLWRLTHPSPALLLEAHIIGALDSRMFGGPLPRATVPGDNISIVDDAEDDAIAVEVLQLHLLNLPPVTLAEQLTGTRARVRVWSVGMRGLSGGHEIDRGWRGAM